ncbi:hypothetical protein [Stenotrophomonas acidaminiphila]|uniref:hypothetical protein n=1 Tax=Stenotrophomonas acidaminiphila TaxID=128780 RepID=UPI001FAF7CF9|nr:hypothetical protein [Stenotrophomonas acidaminiphila]
MLWICALAATSWEATSAIGTAAAAIVALLVWISGLISAYRRRRANARLLAQLLLPEFEKIAAGLNSREARFWKFLHPNTNEQRKAAIESTCDTMAKDRPRARSFAKDILAEIRADRTEILLSQPGIFSIKTADSLANAYRRITHVRHSAHLIIDLIDSETPENIRTAFITYQNVILTTMIAVVETLEELRRIAGLDRKETKFIVAQLLDRPLVEAEQ